MNKFLNGDCFIEGNKIQDCSIDLIFLDPPYELQNDNFINMANDFFIKKLKPDGVLIWFSKMPHNGAVQYLTSKKIQFINEYIWFFTDTTCYRSKSMPLINHQNITIYSNSKQKIILERVRIPNRRKNISIHYKGSKTRGKNGKPLFWKTNENGGWCSSVLQIQKSQTKETLTMPTKPVGVKPTELFGHFIKAYSDINDIILDPFMGLGSSGVSSAKNNRNFIGIEMHKDYFNFAINRILSSTPELF